MSYAEGDSCPKCTRPLSIRSRRADGKQFIGCTGYPECKFTSNDIRLEQPRSGLEKLEDQVSSKVPNPGFDLRELEVILQLCDNAIAQEGRHFTEVGIALKIKEYRQRLTGARKDAREREAAVAKARSIVRTAVPDISDEDLGPFNSIDDQEF